MESQGNHLPEPQEPNKGTTVLRTCFNGINALSGVGILSIPFALSQGGWASMSLLFSVAALCWYTGLLLQRCMETDPAAIKSYPDIGGAAFGPRGRALISVLMYAELFLVAVEFLVLEGDNLDKLFPGAHLHVAGVFGGRRGFVVLAALAVLPTAWVRNLGAMAYVSAGGVVASVAVVVCVFWAGAFDGVGFHGGAGEGGGSVGFRFGGLPTSVSLFLFCYCGHSVFPTLCNSMKDRTHFPKVLMVSFVTSTLTYGSMAILGYLMFGDTLKSQVTLNLPLQKLSTKIAICTTLINPLTKYAVIISPIANAIEDKYPFKNMGTAVSIVIRTLIVFSTVIVALVFPFFGYVMALTGAILSVNVSLLLPCLFYLKINRSARRFGFELVLIAGIVVTGCFVGVAGTFVSMRQIIGHL